MRISILVAGLLALVLAACTTNPVTGRQQLILISADQANALGVDAYEQIKRQLPTVTGTEEARRVDRVGQDIAVVAGGGARNAWEFTLFQDDSPNAFALPGGKVGVNTGLFKVARTDAQLAAVLGHEIAHVLAQHSAERMSRDLASQLGLATLGAATQSQAAVELASAVATVGVSLPFSRDQESEADHVGLLLMARAGYDPRAAIELWRNFETVGGSRPPQFLSTHPAPEDRIARLEQWMPEALEFYQRGADRN